MPRYKIKTLEWWETLGEYEVEAESEAEAIEKVRRGDVECDEHEHPGNADQWGEVLETEVLKDENLST